MPPVKRMLIVEDHERTLHALGRFFRLMGCEVVTAETVAGAIASLHPAPDCVLLDLVLPDGDGEAVLRQVRAEGLATLVAVCTGIDDPERLEALKGLGPDALLLKPLDLDHMLRAYSSMMS